MCVSLRTHLCASAHNEGIQGQDPNLSCLFLSLIQTVWSCGKYIHARTHAQKYSVTKGLNYITSTQKTLTLSQCTALFSINKLEGRTREFPKTPDTSPLWFPWGGNTIIDSWTSVWEVSWESSQKWGRVEGLSEAVWTAKGGTPLPNRTKG